MTSLDPRAPFALEAADPVSGRTVERGIWQITPRVATDVEVGPGSVAVPSEGAVTCWTVHETLRNVYQATGCATAAG